MSRFTLLKYSQNFLHAENLAERIVAKMHLHADTTVLEIGAGKGALTEALLKAGMQVIAWEKDVQLAQLLQAKYRGIKQLQVRQEDFLLANLTNWPNAIVLGNIPFAISAEIFRKLFFSYNKDVWPAEAWLFVQQEFAWRAIGAPYKRNSIFSVLMNNRYLLETAWRFKRTDFRPQPAVDIILLHCQRKATAITSTAEPRFADFVAYTFNRRRPTLRQSLSDIFSHKQMQLLHSQQQINFQLKVSELSAEDWTKLWSAFQQFVNSDKRQIAKNAYKRWEHYRLRQAGTEINY